MGRRRLLSVRLFGAAALMLLLCLGCTPDVPKTKGPLVIVLDGAGWSGSASRIRDGLRAAGFEGRVQSFPWTTLLGPGPDHLLVKHKRRRAADLAKFIHTRRLYRPDDPIHLMGLSAGTAVVVFALEALPRGTTVDNVILFAPSIAATYDLSDAMAHVRGYLYATSSSADALLEGVGVAADGSIAEPAGIHGFRIPARIKCYDCYTRVVNLPWRAAYADLGWRGGHTGATSEEFVRDVIAPRVLSAKSRPLNRPLASPSISKWRSTKTHRARN
jgi:hypothetical protein